MSSTIDEKVVELKFDNGQFESGVKQSMGTLDKLKGALTKDVSSKALDGISKSVKNIDVSGLSKGIETLQDRFSTMGIVGMRVIENITDGLMGGLSKAVHSVTDSIVSGGVRRAMNIENARFQLQGLIDDEEEVQRIMDQANESVDGTAYSYDVAAKAASMFAASGIKSGVQMENALKGIAGVAATANADYERVSELFTTIAGKGRIQAMELNRFASMGMNAAAAITKYMNSVNQGTVEATESITTYVKELTGGLEVTETDLRDMVQKGLISFDLFSEAMGTSFGEHAKDANKTFTGSMANIRAALARTGALFVSPLIKQDGPFVQFFNAIRIKVNEFNKALGATNGMATKFTTWVNGIVTSLTKMVEGFKVANVYTKTLKDGVTSTFESSHKAIMKWGDGTEGIIKGNFYTPFSAFRDVVYSVVNIFKIIKSIITPIGDAFSFVFNFDSAPIYAALENFRRLTGSFKLSQEEIFSIYDAFKGLFDIIKTGIGLIVRLIGAISPFGIVVEDLGADFLELAGNVGRTLSDFSDMVNNSEALDFIFKKIKDTVAILSANLSLFISIAQGFIIDNLTSGFDRCRSAVELFKNALSGISSVGGIILGGLASAVDGLKAAFQPLADTIAPFLILVRDSFIDTIQRVGPVKAFLEILNGVLLTKLLFWLKEISKTWAWMFSTGNFSSTDRVLGKVAKNLNHFVNLIDAEALKTIAISIGILVAAMYGLAALDADKLITSLSAVTMLLGEMIGLLYLISNLTSSTDDIRLAFSGVLDAMKMDTLAGTLIKMAAAVLLLSFAVKSLGSMNFEDLAKGISAVTVLLIELVAVLAIINKMGGPANISEIGIGLIFVSAAIAIMAKSVKSLAELDIKSLVKGLGSVGALLLGLTIFTKIVGGSVNLDTIGVGLLFVSGALLIMSKVITSLAELNISEIVQGLISIGSLLLALGVFVKATSGSDVVATSFGMVLISGALLILSKAMGDIAKLSWDEIGRALVAIASTLLILCTAINEIGYMGTKEGLVAVIELAAITAVLRKPLAETLERLSLLSWDGILRAVIVIGAVLYELILAMKQLKDIGRWGTAGGIAALAALVKVLEYPLSNTLQNLAKLGWEGMIISIIAMGAALAELVGTMYIFTKFNKKMMAKAFAGVLMLGLMSLELIPISNSLTKIGSIGWEGVLPGLAGLAGAILIMIGAMYLAGVAWQTGIPEVGAACLLVCALSMLPIASAMKSLGTMDWKSIGHACAALGSALLILIAAMYIAGFGTAITIAGAIAIRIVAGALPLIAKGMVTLTKVNWDSIGDACTKLAKSLIILIAASYLAKILGDIDFDKIKDYVNKLIVTLAYIGIATKLISGISNTNWPEVYNGLKNLLKSILLLEFASNVMGGVALAGMASVAILRMFSKLFLGAITDIVAALDVINTFKAGDNFTSALKDVASGIAILGLSLKTFGPLSFIGAYAMLNLSEAIVNLVPALKDLVTMDPEKIGSTMKSLGSSLTTFGESMKSFGILSGIGASAMLKLSEAVANMAPALKTLSEIEQDKLASILGSLGGAFKLFGEALEATPFWGSKMRAAGIGALIDNITKLTEVLPPFMALNPHKASKSLDVLGEAFKDFGTALSKTPFWDSKGRAGGIGALIENIPLLTNALPGFMELPSNQVKENLTNLAVGFAQFGGSLDAAPFWGVADRGAAISVLVNSIAELTNGLKLFSELDSASIKPAITDIATAFTVFAYALDEAPFWGVADRGDAISVLVNSIDNLANGLKTFLDLDADVDTISSVMDIIKTAFVTFGQALSEAPFWGVKDRGTAISTLINSIDKLVPAIQQFKNLGADDVKTIMAAVGDALVSLGDSIKSTPFWDSSGRSGALTSVVTSINTLIDAFIKIKNSSLNAGELSTTIGLMAGAIRVFGSALNDYGSMSEAYAQVFTVLVNGITAIASVDPETFLADVQALKELIEVIKSMATVNVESMNNFANGLSDLGSNALAGFISAFNTNSGTATTSVTNFINNICVILQSRNTDIHKYGAETAEEWLKGIATKYSMATATGKKLGEQVLSALRVLYTQFKQVGITSAQQYGQGIHATAKYVIDIAKALAMDAYKNLNPKDEKGQSLFYKAGQDAGQGYIDGIKSKKGEAKKAGEEMAGASQEGTTKENDSHSPSKAFYKLGSYGGQGYVNALHEWAKEAYDAGKKLAAASQAGIIDNEFNEPIIRPVVDLENVFDAANTVNQMFSSAMMSTMVRTNAASGSMVSNASNNPDEKFQNGQNSSGNNYTFNQYNNSPKALSRIEIYRDTKSLMQSYREAVERA